MKSILSGLGIALAVIMLFTQGASAAELKAPDGYILVEESLIEYFVDEPESSFIDAADAFEEGNLEESARALRKSAAFLRIEGKTLNNEGSDLRLRESATRLESLARRVENEEIESVAVMESAFAHAHYALGMAYTMEGEKYWEQEATEKTQKALKRASGGLKSAAKWSKQQVSDAGSATMKGISSAGAGVKAGSEKVTGWIKSLNVTANTLGETIEDK